MRAARCARCQTVRIDGPAFVEPVSSRAWTDWPTERIICLDWSVRYGNIGRHRVMALAAGMTYYSILAIFPALAALVAIYGLFSDPASIAKHLDQISGFVPGGAVEVAREQLTRVSSKGNHVLGVTFVIGLACSLWSANAAMKSLFATLNIVYGEEEKRGFIKLNAVSLTFTVAAIVFVLVALGAVIVIPVALNYLHLSNSRIRRRTYVVRIFPNAESCLRLVRALTVERHEAWLEDHRYLNMDLLKEHKKETLRQAA